MEKFPAKMVDCQVCKRHVDYKYLRSNYPKDEFGHDLGKWVYCENNAEKHVYLRNQQNIKCPFCGSTGFSNMKDGIKVKCLHKTDKGMSCEARPYLWIKEGPPCFMNHIEKTCLEV